MRHVARKPDQTRGIYWLTTPGASFDDIVHGRAPKFDQTEISLPLSRQAMEQGAGERFNAMSLLPATAPDRAWVLAAWCSRQEFDTPTGELGPGEYNSTGVRETYGNTVTWNDGTGMETASEADIEIERKPEDPAIVQRIRRKGQR